MIHYCQDQVWGSGQGPVSSELATPTWAINHKPFFCQNIFSSAARSRGRHQRDEETGGGWGKVQWALQSTMTTQPCAAFCSCFHCHGQKGYTPVSFRGSYLVKVCDEQIRKTFWVNQWTSCQMDPFSYLGLKQICRVGKLRFKEDRRWFIR